MAKDKVKHLVGGIFIGLAFGMLHVSAGVVIAILAGWAKEEWDKHHGGQVEFLDFLCTAVGGVIGAAVAYAIKGHP
jgi:hypothetical protein